MAIGPMKPDGGGSKQNKPTEYRPTAPPPPAPSYTPPIYTNNMGQYNNRPSPPPQSNPGPVPDINGYLGQDSGYQGQLAALAKALSDFQADTTRRKGGLEADFASSDKALRGQRDMDLQSIKDDYGARGLLRSGLFGKAMGDYESEFNTRIGDLSRKQAEALALLQQEFGQFSSQQELAQQQAREAAIRRRAETYGV